MPTKEKIRQTVLDLFRTEKDDWLRRAKRRAAEIIIQKGRVTADDIHEQVPIPHGIDPRIMGSVFRTLRSVGQCKSKRKECHHRRIGIFA